MSGCRPFQSVMVYQNRTLIYVRIQHAELALATSRRGSWLIKRMFVDAAEATYSQFNPRLPNYR